MIHRFLLAGAPALLVACTSDLPTSSRLSDLRILALLADPLEVGPDDTLSSRPVVHVPAGEVVSHAWTFCPLGAGPQAGYACALPACERAIEPGPDGSATFVPGALARTCAGLPRASVLEAVLTYRARGAGGTERVAIARVPLHAAAPPVSNRPPRIAEVHIGGAPAQVGVPLSLTIGEGLPVQVHTATASIEPGEAVLVSYFATAAAFDTERTEGTVGTATLEPEGEAPLGAVTIWVVVRDGRGGQAAAGPFEVDAR